MNRFFSAQQWFRRWKTNSDLTIQEIPSIHSRPTTLRLLGIFILLVAFLLRIWEIDARAFWFDEAVEFWTAQTTFVDLPRTVRISLQPPLYTYFLHFGLIVSTNIFWLRFLSVVLSVLTVLALMIWGYRRYSVWGGFTAGIVMAVLPGSIRYAQEAGEYALMVCALSWSLVFLDDTFRSNRWYWWILWGIFCIASVYSHYGSVLVILPVSFLVFGENIVKERYSAILQQLTVSAVGILSALPLLFFLPRQLARFDRGTAPVSSLSMHPAELFSSLVTTFEYQLLALPYSLLPSWIGTVVIGLICVLVLVVSVAPVVQISRRPILWLFGAFLCYFMAVKSGFYAYGNFGFRYALILSPLLGIAVAAGVAQLISWRQVAAAVSILVITLSAALSIFFLHRQQVVHIWPESYEAIEPVVAYWHEQRRVQEPTYVYYGAVPAFSYYCLLYDLAVPSPYAREMPPPSTSIYYGRWFRSWSTVEKVESIWHTMKGSPKRFWLVFSHIYPGEDQEILEALQDSYSIRDSIKNRGTSLFLLERQ